MKSVNTAWIWSTWREVNASTSTATTVRASS